MQKIERNDLTLVHFKNTNDHDRGKRMCLTQFAACCGGTYVSVRARATRRMLNDLTESIDGTRVIISARVDAKSVATRRVRWAITVARATCLHCGFGCRDYYNK